MNKSSRFNVWGSSVLESWKLLSPYTYRQIIGKEVIDSASWFLPIKEYKRDFKYISVHYLGGKCLLCGYNRCIQSLDFHHVYPQNKSFAISQNGIKLTRGNKDKILSEIDKCVLLCKNCHSEYHFGGMMNAPDKFVKEITTRELDRSVFDSCIH